MVRGRKEWILLHSTWVEATNLLRVKGLQVSYSKWININGWWDWKYVHSE